VCGLVCACELCVWLCVVCVCSVCVVGEWSGEICVFDHVPAVMESPAVINQCTYSIAAAAINQCTNSIAAINQCTYSIAAINQCTYSIAAINQCTYNIAAINQCTYSIAAINQFTSVPAGWSHQRLQQFLECEDACENSVSIVYEYSV
jgi:hypothetical protein